MQTVIVINLASYVVWAWDKAFAVLFVLSMNLSICVLKAVIYLYIKTQHSHANAKFVTSGEADTPALTLYAPADEIGNVTETRRLSFSVPLHGMAGSSNHVPPVDVEEPLGGTGGGMNIFATIERSLDTDREGYGYTSSEHNEYPPTVYEPILESNPTVNMPLDVHGRTEAQAEGLYTEATVSSEEKYSWPATKEEASKEEKELGVIAERKTMISEKESPDEYSPDEYIIPTPQDVDLTKEGAVINNENPLEQRTVPVRTTDS